MGQEVDADELVNVYIESAALHALLHESATLHHYSTPLHHDLRYITSHYTLCQNDPTCIKCMYSNIVGDSQVD